MAIYEGNRNVGNVILKIGKLNIEDIICGYYAGLFNNFQTTIAVIANIVGAVI